MFEPTLPLDVVLDIWMTRHPDRATVSISETVLEDCDGDVLHKHMMYAISRFGQHDNNGNGWGYGFTTTTHRVCYMQDPLRDVFVVRVFFNNNTHD
jgi:hypothetical protein